MQTGPTSQISIFREKISWWAYLANFFPKMKIWLVGPVCMGEIGSRIRIHSRLSWLFTMQKISLIAQSVLELSHCENGFDDNNINNDNDDDTHQGWIKVCDKKVFRCGQFPWIFFSFPPTFFLAQIFSSDWLTDGRTVTWMDRLTAGLTGGWFDRQAARRQEGGTDRRTFSMSHLLATKKSNSIWTFPSLQLNYTDRKYDIHGLKGKGW